MASIVGTVRRISIPILAVIVIALGLGLLVGGVTPSTATVVNGAKTSTSTVNAELKSITSNHAYLCYLNVSELIRSQGQTGLLTPQGATSASISSGFVANYLNQDITNQIIHQAAEREGLLPISQQDLLGAQTDLLAAMDASLSQATGTQYDCGGTAAQILSTMPESFVRSQIEAQAESEALLVAHGGLTLDAAAVQAYYDAHTSDFDTYCVSGIVLSDPSSYAKIQAGLAAGTSFADLAKQYSQDTTSAAKGGVLGCFGPSSPSYASVVADAKNLTVGVPSGPILQGSSSELVLLVTSRTTTPLSGIENYVRRTMLSKDAAASTAVARALVTSATVTLNPLYGSWSTAKALTGVVPPTVPPGKDLINSIAISPGATGV